MRRLAVAILVVLSITALVLVGTRGSTAAHPTKPPHDPISQIEGRSSAPVIAPRLIAAAMDPCADYDALEAGHGTPERQDLFNHQDARGYARWRMACVYRWGTSEWTCLDNIWTHESNWRHDIRGRIPQAMPETKIATEGADWRSNPRTQVRWGLRYIADRYGRPSRAGITPPYTRQSCDAGY